MSSGQKTEFPSDANLFEAVILNEVKDPVFLCGGLSASQQTNPETQQAQSPSNRHKPK